MTWRPALAGVDADRAREIVIEIASALAARPIELAGAGASLARGEPGIGLAFAYLARVTGDAAYAEHAEARLGAALEHAVASPSGPHLWYGLAGVVWAAEQAMALLEPAGEATDADATDPYAEVDDILVGYLQTREPKHLDVARETLLPYGRKGFELLGGAAGLVVYALERMPRRGARRVLEHAVAALRARAIPDGDGTCWEMRFDELTIGERAVFPDGYRALGLAHGTAGVFAALAGAAAWNVEGAREAAAAAFRWLISQRLENGSFPAMRGSEAHPQASWCWGDAGIAAALATAAHAIGVDEWHAAALALAESLAARSVERCALDEAHLCHGAIGLAHALNRFAQQFEREDFADAARGWYRRGLAMHRPGRGIGGFVALERAGDTFAPAAFAGLLDGSAGIALALAAAIGTVEPIWDRAFALSIRDQSQVTSALP